MFCYGYTGRLRTDYRDCFGDYRDRLHENHQVGLKLYGLRTLKVHEENKDRLRTTQVL